MNVVLYFVCLVLMLPVVGLALFGALVESLTHFGLGTVLETLFSVLVEPFGKGLWFFLSVLFVLVLFCAGFVPAARPAGFGTMALLSVVSGIFFMRTYSNAWEWNTLVLFMPSIVGLALSVYCIAKPIR